MRRDICKFLTKDFSSFEKNPLLWRCLRNLLPVELEYKVHSFNPFRIFIDIGSENDNYLCVIPREFADDEYESVKLYTKVLLDDDSVSASSEILSGKQDGQVIYSVVEVLPIDEYVVFSAATMNLHCGEGDYGIIDSIKIGNWLYDKSVLQEKAADGLANIYDSMDIDYFDVLMQYQNKIHGNINNGMILPDFSMYGYVYGNYPDTSKYDIYFDREIVTSSECSIRFSSEFRNIIREFYDDTMKELTDICEFGIVDELRDNNEKLIFNQFNCIEFLKKNEAFLEKSDKKVYTKK